MQKNGLPRGSADADAGLMILKFPAPDCDLNKFLFFVNCPVCILFYQHTKLEGFHNFFFFVSTGVELRALHLLGRRSTT
jgi:hypothetical protein